MNALLSRRPNNMMRTFLLWAAIFLQFSKLSSSCGERLVGSGYIMSPNYPAEYTNNLRCTWTLIAQPSQGNIVLDVIAFATEPCCDHLYFENTTGITLHRLSGTHVSSLIVLGNSAVVRFVTDQSVMNRGFSIRFTTTVMADFSRYNLTVNTSCDLLSAKFNGWHESLLDVQPSSVVFSMKANDSSQIVTQRTAYDSANESISFPVDYNTTYSVWAAPETCWPKMACDPRTARQCTNSNNCTRGRETVVATVTTVVPKYELNKEGNGAFVTIFSPQECKPPQKITASCQTFVDYLCDNNATRQEHHLCVANHYFRCNLEVILHNGKTMHTIYNFDYVKEEETKESSSSIFMAAIIGGSSCFALIIAAVTTALILKHRNARRSFESSCVNISAPTDTDTMVALYNAPTNSIEMATHQEDDVENLYVNMNSAFNEPHSTEFRYTEKSTAGLTDEGNTYAC